MRLSKPTRTTFCAQRVGALVGPGGMIEDVPTAEDLSTRFWINEIIQGYQQTAIREWIWNRVTEPAPQFGPWQPV